MPDARRGRWTVRRPRALAAGAVVTLAALGPPLHAAAGDRLAAHMAQHVVLVGVAAPLLAAAVARPVASGRWARWTAAAVVVHVGVTLAWHLPVLYDAATDTAAVHAVEHWSFLAAAFGLWYLLVSSRQRAGPAVVALFVATLPFTGLGALMTVADDHWYRAYAANGLADQQLAGVVMWAYGGLAAVAGGVALFAWWLAGIERVANARPAGRTTT